MSRCYSPGESNSQKALRKATSLIKKKGVDCHTIKIQRDENESKMRIRSRNEESRCCLCTMAISHVVRSRQSHRDNGNSGLRW